jgi:beta-glucosidase
MKLLRLAGVLLVVLWAAFAAGVPSALAGASSANTTTTHGDAGSKAAEAQLAQAQQASADAQASACSQVGSTVQLEPMKQAQQQAEALASKMTLSQDLTLMHGVSPQATPDGTVGATAAIPSLGIPSVSEEDGPAGVGDGVQGVTQLPAPVDLAATFDDSLASCYGKVIGTEQRGKGVDEDYGPTINIDRVPQWGRSFEALTEDPFLDGDLAAAEVNGIQSQGEMAEVKHFAVYNQETNRNTPADDAIVSQQALQEIYTSAWQTVIDKSNPAAIMCSYSTVNGTAACQNPELMTNILDGQFGYQGFVGSDFGGTHSTVASVNAGLDQEQPETTFFGAPLQQAVTDGQVSMSTIKDAVVRILSEMFRFKLFTDAPTGNLSDTVTNAADQDTGLAIAEAGTTLLKNDDNVLPYSASGTSSIAVIGADASTSPMTDGGGSASVVPSSVVTPLQGIQDEVGSGTTVTYNDGSDVTTAATAASSAQEAVVFVNDVETEGADRTSLELPGNQDQLIEAVAAANPHTVVVLNTGAPVLMPWLSQIAGLVEAWYPGQDDGTAIAQVLFGQTNPSGHLPVTFPASASQTPVSTPQQFPGVNGQVDYSEGLDVGYRFYDANNVTPLFPFGFGLSYTNFKYSNLRITPLSDVADGNQNQPLAQVTATVTNAGKVAGADVAQVYIGDPASAGQPPRQLEGYQRVSLNPGQSTRVSFTIDAKSMSFWSDSANAYVVPAGTFTVYAGDSSALANLPLQGSLRIGDSAGPQSVTVAQPSVLPAGNDSVKVTFSNTSSLTDHGASLGLSVSTAGAPIPAASAAKLLTVRQPEVSLGTVAPGATVTRVFHVTVPSSAPAGSYTFTGTAAYDAAGTWDTTTGTAATSIAFASVASAFDGVGIVPAADVAAGNYDGGGFSFQQQELTADGFAPGDTVAAEGGQLTLPPVASGAPDEITAEGQVIDLNQSGGELGFLGSGTFGTQSGTVTVNYTDGTSSTATLSMGDWFADAAAPGTVIAASGQWNVPASETSSFGPETVAVYYAQLPVDASKTIASVTLPNNAEMHFFDVGVPSPATYPSVKAAYDDTGIAPAASSVDGNYDGGGFSFDADALPAAGLAPGASVTAQGVPFTWPSFGPGAFDNVRAAGQTIAVSGSGTSLGFLGSGSNGAQSGTVTINYTDGTSSTATLSLADWFSDTAAPGGTIVGTVTWNPAAGSTLGAHQVSVYSAVLPLTAGKTVASVTLPENFQMHIFAIGVGG